MPFFKLILSPGHVKNEYAELEDITDTDTFINLKLSYSCADIPAVHWNWRGPQAYFFQAYFFVYTLFPELRQSQVPLFWTEEHCGCPQCTCNVEHIAAMFVAKYA